MASTFWSSCPSCLYDNVKPIHRLKHQHVNHFFSFVCSCCGHQWSVCCNRNCQLPSHKNLFHTRKQQRDHLRHWHPKITDGNQPINVNDFGDNVAHESLFDSPNLMTFSFGSKSMAQFAKWCILGDATQAIQCLVQQAMFQEPVSLELASSVPLSTTAIHLFLHISTMLVTTGQTHHVLLSNILSILLDLLPSTHSHWPIMPCSVSGFQSHILNPTNKYSLVSLLPQPTTYMLSDNAHGYCCLQEIAAFVLLLPQKVGSPPIPFRLKQLCQSHYVQQFIQQPSVDSPLCLVSLGIIFWMDGWDPSASSKNNRSPVHTASATLICIDNNTGLPFNVRTFPIACGPGKADHNVIFQALEHSLCKLQSNNELMWSHHHNCRASVKVKVLAFLMDQPERRGSHCLLGGNSKQHALFGVSCDFEKLKLNFAACAQCVSSATGYLIAGNFSSPLPHTCKQCYGFSLTNLVTNGVYCPIEPNTYSVETPGYQLSTKPGFICFGLLIDAWNHGIRMFVTEKLWGKKEIEAYFTMLCINMATIDQFLLCCRNYMLVEAITYTPQNYDHEMKDHIATDSALYPDIYKLPSHPTGWHIGTINQRVETIMHLAMNTQKAVFKLLLQWAASLDLGPTLRKHLSPLVEVVQNLRLPFLPVRMFKNDKFGGFVAENYRALAMLSPWLFRCLLHSDFIPKTCILAPQGKPRSKWTVKENNAWLKSRCIPIPTRISAKERTALVDWHFTRPGGPPPRYENTAPSVTDMRQKLCLMFQVFGTLFVTNLQGEIAGNRFEALVVQFLHCVQTMGVACYPAKKKLIWLSKYGMLGLLRCRPTFLRLYVSSFIVRGRN